MYNNVNTSSTNTDAILSLRLRNFLGKLAML